MATIRPLDLGDQSLVSRYLKRYPPKISELTFTNLFVWRGSRPVWLVEIEDSLVFLANARGEDDAAKVLLGPPLGEASPLSVSQAIGMDLEGFVRVPENTAEILRNAGLNVTHDRDNSDYVYKVADLAELQGRRFHKKRNHINQCLAAHRCEYEPITPQLVTECLDFQDRWCQARECGKNPALCNEYVAVREAFINYRDLQILGGAIRVDGAIEAYALGEELNPNTGVWHFEKAMPGVQGLGQLINQWFSKYALTGFEYINREQDLGIQGLRQAKESYYPDHMVDKFTATVKEPTAEMPSLMNPHECAKHSLGEE
ncbi:MAG: DUF2156 domain-containing protein [Deltaproteobacteria bacterium]|nr:DUF2156 domain-containing protein [Deltaproteobacteria bacterium]